MKLYVGTSGYSYKEWKGNFYPEDLPAKEMLSFYSRRLPAVEINNTFYRLPQPAMIENWKAQVPTAFRFSIKATQRITHIKRLKVDAAILLVSRSANSLGANLVITGTWGTPSPGDVMYYYDVINKYDQGGNVIVGTQVPFWRVPP